MSFENLIGNDKIKQILTNSIKSNTVLHSYMFIGPSGIGKTLFAKEFAKMILCQNREQNVCNRCKSCIEIENNNNPDLIEILPEGGTIKIEAIRTIQEKVKELPIISNKKVYIIKDADKMTKEAQNCLLKTLEEPPKFITIIMTGSNESMFLTTIKSRCMKITFNKIENEVLRQFLNERYNISTNFIEACGGSIEKALLVNEKKEEYEKILNIFSNIENYELLDVINKIEFIYKNKDNIYDMLDYINSILSSKKLDNYKYIKYIDVVEQTKKKLKANSNFDMSIDNMIYKIWDE